MAFHRNSSFGNERRLLWERLRAVLRNVGGRLFMGIYEIENSTTTPVFIGKLF